MPYDQYSWLFAIGTLACALDAFNIGANDVANSFATSVSSKSLTMRQACACAAVCEFLGAVLVGARVAGTIKNSIVSLSTFNGNAALQMLAFTCALTVSASWLMIATKNSWPVSTTYSIVSSLAGVGVAVGGRKSVNWGWNGGKGLGAIFAGLLIAPSISAGFGAIVFLFTKYIVLVRKDSVRAALFASPLYFFTVAAVCTMSIVYKGSPSLSLDKLPETTVAAAIVGTAAVVSVLSIIFWLPYVYCKVVRKDTSIRFYHFFFGPYLWYRPTPPVDENSTQSFVPDYRVYQEETAAPTAEVPSGEFSSDKERDIEGSSPSAAVHPSPLHEVEVPPVVERPEGNVWDPKVITWFLRYKVFGLFTHGTTVDIHALQNSGVNGKEAARMEAMHRSARQYPNETEHLYSFLQVLTACTASFAHGANDVSNAVGPYAAIYEVWRTSGPLKSSTPTPIWILAFGGAMIVIGLATYGYNIMSVLGNRLTLHSPSRGFSMELGAGITVLLASQYGIPVSTTMCIVGATVGVALCNGDAKSFNWRGLAHIWAGWVLTIPFAGTAAGLLMSILVRSPSI